MCVCVTQNWLPRNSMNSLLPSPGPCQGAMEMPRPVALDQWPGSGNGTLEMWEWSEVLAI